MATKAQVATERFQDGQTWRDADGVELHEACEKVGGTRCHVTLSDKRNDRDKPVEVEAYAFGDGSYVVITDSYWDVIPELGDTLYDGSGYITVSR